MPFSAAFLAAWAFLVSVEADFLGGMVVMVRDARSLGGNFKLWDCFLGTV